MCLFARLVSASVRGSLAPCPQSPSSELNSSTGRAARSLPHLADFPLPALCLWPLAGGLRNSGGLVLWDRPGFWFPTDPDIWGGGGARLGRNSGSIGTLRKSNWNTSQGNLQLSNKSFTLIHVVIFCCCAYSDCSSCRGRGPQGGQWGWSRVAGWGEGKAWVATKGQSLVWGKRRERYRQLGYKRGNPQECRTVSGGREEGEV